MAPLRVTEIAPGVRNDRDDDDRCEWVKRAAETTYHPVGTCKMGVDPMAVVDPRLRVHGIGGLRVADASIMPTLTSGNTNAPSIMIGEKAVELISKTHGVRVPALVVMVDTSRRHGRRRLDIHDLRCRNERSR